MSSQTPVIIITEEQVDQILDQFVTGFFSQFVTEFFNQLSTKLKASRVLSRDGKPSKLTLDLSTLRIFQGLSKQTIRDISDVLSEVNITKKEILQVCEAPEKFRTPLSRL